LFATLHFPGGENPPCPHLSCLITDKSFSVFYIFPFSKYYLLLSEKARESIEWEWYFIWLWYSFSVVDGNKFLEFLFRG